MLSNVKSTVVTITLCNYNGDWEWHSWWCGEMFSSRRERLA